MPSSTFSLPSKQTADNKSKQMVQLAPESGLLTVMQSEPDNLDDTRRMSRRERKRDRRDRKERKPRKERSNTFLEVATDLDVDKDLKELITAMEAESVYLVQELISKRTAEQLNLRDPAMLGATLLHLAAAKTNTQLIEMLVKAGIDVNSKSIRETELSMEKYDYLSKFRPGTTPIYIATVAGNAAVVHSLASFSANPNLSDNEGYYPLHNAAWNNHTDLIKALISYGAKVNVTDSSGSTPLRKAAYRGNIDCVKYLLGMKADVNAQNYQGRTALHCAALFGHIDVIEALVDAKAKVDIQDKDELTPLHAAVYNGKRLAVKLLLSYKARINVETKFGNTPLHIACVEKWFVVAQMLLNEGADIEKKNKFGETCADLLFSGSSGKRLNTMKVKKLHEIPRAELEKLELESHAPLFEKLSSPRKATEPDVQYLTQLNITTPVTGGSPTPPPQNTQ